MEKKIGIVFDGGYVAKIFKDKCDRVLLPNDVVKLAEKIKRPDEEIFRIYYYNAPPFSGTLRNPLTDEERDYSMSDVVKRMEWFHRELSKKDFVALRLGEIRPSGWTLPVEVIAGIRNGAIKGVERLHLRPVFKQKAVDIKIGLDMALLAVKKIVDRIVLVTADNDFVPVMKFVRREGLQVILVQIEDKITHPMKEHADLVRFVDLKTLDQEELGVSV